MPERSNGTVSKTVVPFRVPRVRIPVFPQKQKELPRVAPFVFTTDRGEPEGSSPRSACAARIPVFPQKQKELPRVAPFFVSESFIAQLFCLGTADFSFHKNELPAGIAKQLDISELTSPTKSSRVPLARGQIQGAKSDKTGNLRQSRFFRGGGVIPDGTGGIGRGSLLWRGGAWSAAGSGRC